jgi:hypothetical protein
LKVSKKIFIFIFLKPYFTKMGQVFSHIFILKIVFKCILKHVILQYLSKKECSLFVLFCLYLWDPPNQYASYYILGLFGKPSMRRGAWAWFHNIWTCMAKVLEYWMKCSLKIKLNIAEKFGGIEMYLWYC